MGTFYSAWILHSMNTISENSNIINKNSELPSLAPNIIKGLPDHAANILPGQERSTKPLLPKVCKTNGCSCQGNHHDEKGQGQDHMFENYIIWCPCGYQLISSLRNAEDQQFSSVQKNRLSRRYSVYVLDHCASIFANLSYIIMEQGSNLGSSLRSSGSNFAEKDGCVIMIGCPREYIGILMPL